uniref:DUF5641 domain-containing protein n=1 Tax=Meloidogyne floridensis TaxID=298350 RepID=A0A915NW68_9BILA
MDTGALFLFDELKIKNVFAINNTPLLPYQFEYVGKSIPYKIPKKRLEQFKDRKGIIKENIWSNVLELLEKLLIIKGNITDIFGLLIMHGGFLCDTDHRPELENKLKNLDDHKWAKFLEDKLYEWENETLTISLLYKNIKAVFINSDELIDFPLDESKPENLYYVGGFHLDNELIKKLFNVQSLAIRGLSRLRNLSSKDDGITEEDSYQEQFIKMEALCDRITNEIKIGEGYLNEIQVAINHWTDLLRKLTSEERKTANEEYEKFQTEKQVESVIEAVETMLLKLRDHLSEASTKSKLLANKAEKERKAEELDHAKSLKGLTSVQTQNVTPQAVSSIYQLPTLQIKRFSGDRRDWVEFYESFRCAVDTGAGSDIEKLTLLRNLLDNEPRELISGFRLEAKNYKEALHLLKDHYGDKEAYVRDLHTRLSNLKVCNTLNDVKKFSLELERISTWSTSLFRTTLLEALEKETEIQEVIAEYEHEQSRKQQRQNFHQKYNFKKPISDARPNYTYATMVQNKIRPLANLSDRLNNTKIKQPSKMKIRNITQSANNITPNCIFCGDDHWTDKCFKITNPQARLEAVRKKRQGNVVTQDQSDQTNLVNYETNQINKIGYRNSKSLLMTLEVTVYNPMKPHLSKRALIFIDPGAQRSFISAELADTLKLPIVAKETCRLTSFGEKCAKEYDSDLVRINLLCQAGEKMSIVLNKLNFLVNPLPHYDLKKLTQEELNQLKLITNVDYRQPDILLGMDIFHELNVQQKETLPSGFTINTEDKNNDSLIINDFENNKQLATFFGLHSIGMDDSTLPVDEDEIMKNFKKNLTFVEGRYQVALPFNHRILSLPTNYRHAKMRLATIDIFKSGGMKLREFFGLTRKESRGMSEDLLIRNQIETKILGIRWNLKEEYLIFKMPTFEGQITKRNILAAISKIYDPIGLISPVLIQAKLLLQKIFEANYKWDAPIEQSFCLEWNKIMLTWKESPEIKIPRFLGNKQINSQEFHCFTDASKYGFGAAIYVKTSEEGSHPGLIFSKSLIKPASLPSNATTIPKLELQALTLGAKMIKFLQNELNFNMAQATIWSDSQCNIERLRRPGKYDRFVTNRLIKIRNLCSLLQHKTELSIITSGDIKIAETYLIKSIQEQYAPSEEAKINLQMFSDQGIWKCHGRIDESDLKNQTKSPIFLPDSCEKDEDYVPPNLENKEINKELKFIQLHLNKFWNIWHNSYLTSLRERVNKSSNETLVPQIGEIVIVEQSEAPRSVWKLGKIIELIKGRDNIIRTAKIQINKKIFLRSINLIFPLELKATMDNSKQLMAATVVSSKPSNIKTTPVKSNKWGREREEKSHFEDSSDTEVEVLEVQKRPLTPNRPIFMDKAHTANKVSVINVTNSTTSLKTTSGFNEEAITDEEELDYDEWPTEINPYSSLPRGYKIPRIELKKPKRLQTAGLNMLIKSLGGTKYCHKELIRLRHKQQNNLEIKRKLEEIKRKDNLYKIQLKKQGANVEPSKRLPNWHKERAENVMLTTELDLTTPNRENERKMKAAKHAASLARRKLGIKGSPEKFNEEAPRELQINQCTDIEVFEYSIFTNCTGVLHERCRISNNVSSMAQSRPNIQNLSFPVVQCLMEMLIFDWISRQHTNIKYRQMASALIFTHHKEGIFSFLRSFWYLIKKKAVKAFNDKAIMNVLEERLANCHLLYSIWAKDSYGPIRLKGPPLTENQELNQWLNFITDMVNKGLTKRRYNFFQGRRFSFDQPLFKSNIVLIDAETILVSEWAIQDVLFWTNDSKNTRLVTIDGSKNLQNIFFIGRNVRNLVIIVKADEELAKCIDSSLNFFKESNIKLKTTIILIEPVRYTERLLMTRQMFNIARTYQTNFFICPGKPGDLKRTKEKMINQSIEEEEEIPENKISTASFLTSQLPLFKNKNETMDDSIAINKEQLSEKSSSPPTHKRGSTSTPTYMYTFMTILLLFLFISTSVALPIINPLLIPILKRGEVNQTPTFPFTTKPKLKLLKKPARIIVTVSPALLSKMKKIKYNKTEITPTSANTTEQIKTTILPSTEQIIESKPQKLISNTTSQPEKIKLKTLNTGTTPRYWPDVDQFD